MPLGANKAAIMGVAGVSTGDVVLLSSQTATSDATLSFTSGITSTYGEYIFRFYSVSPETDGENLTFQVSTDGGSSYGLTVTSSYFMAYHTEADESALTYLTGEDQAQGTAFQRISHDVGDGADESAVGELHLFNPSSTTYVKHFYSRSVNYGANHSAQDEYCGGYFNTTSDIDAVQFKFSSGDFDGTIKMWGVK